MEKTKEEYIKQAVKDEEAWCRIPTSISGVFLVKLPNKEIIIEVNPMGDDGRPIKRRGLFLKKSQELLQFLEAMMDPDTYELLGTLERMD